MFLNLTYSRQDQILQLSLFIGNKLIESISQKFLLHVTQQLVDVDNKLGLFAVENAGNASILAIKLLCFLSVCIS